MKKVLSFVFVFAMLFTMAVPLSATASAQIDTDGIFDINSIIEEVNAEYGTEFFIITPSEARLLGPTGRGDDFVAIDELSHSDIAQFERELHEIAAFLAAENAKAEAAWEAAVAESLLPANESEAISSRALRAPKSGTRNVIGASIYFEGWANNNPGYWVWEHLTITRVNSSLTDPTFRFQGNSHTATFIDSRRTCAVSYKGIMYIRANAFGMWIGSPHTHYIEWNANNLR